MKGIAFFLMAALVALFSFCTEKKADDASCAIDDPNPNKSSELAVLMRQMATQAEQLKKEVAAGHISSSFPEAFRKIHTAVPTDSTIKGDAFDGYATGYLQNLEAVFASGDDLTGRYNDVINTCISCHETSCPGPLVRINKMLLK